MLSITINKPGGHALGSGCERLHLWQCPTVARLYVGLREYKDVGLAAGNGRVQILLVRCGHATRYDPTLRSAYHHPQSMSANRGATTETQNRVGCRGRCGRAAHAQG